MKFTKKSTTEALLERALTGRHRKMIKKQIETISGIEISEDQLDKIVAQFKESL